MYSVLRSCMAHSKSSVNMLLLSLLSHPVTPKLIMTFHSKNPSTFFDFLFSDSFLKYYSNIHIFQYFGILEYVTIVMSVNH